MTFKPPRPYPSRRDVIAGGAAALATVPLGAIKALGQVGASGEVDVAIVGAGAAGIAAARRVASAGRSYALLEASARVGGRALTDTALFGMPFDVGAHWIHLPGSQPLADHGKALGFDIYSGPDAARLYMDGKEASDTEYEDFVGTVRRAERAIIAAGDAARDLPAAHVLPDLGPFGPSAHFMAGPFFCAKDLSEVSTVDFSRAEEREQNAVCRQGYGTLLAKLAEPLAVRLNTPVRAVDLSGRQVAVEMKKGKITARVVIVAVPPSIITSGMLRIQPGMVPRYRSAIERITLGAYDHIAFTLPGNPLELKSDELIHFRAKDKRAYALLARIGGSEVYSLEVGGAFAAELAEAKTEAVLAFLKEALAHQFGAEVAAKAARMYHTRWTKEPFALGAFSCALPGAGNLRRALTEVVSGRLLFAGEHAHETLWGTVGGAWLSGERAAGQALTILGVAHAGQ